MRNVREYHRPTSAEEAVHLKRKYGEHAAYLAGGSDLMVHKPETLVALIDIRHAGLSDVTEDSEGISIGGAALLRDVETVAGHAGHGMLGLAVRETAPWLIRNAATLAGNLANASPAADSVPALLVLDAELDLLDDAARRRRAADILLGPHRTSLGDALIRTIHIPEQASARRAAFIKHARSKSDIAQVNVAVAFRLDGRTVRDVRIALGAVAPTALRATGAEQLLEGQEPTREALQAVEQAVRAEVRPISDWRGTAEYRRRVSGVLARRAFERALAIDRDKVA